MGKSCIKSSIHLIYQSYSIVVIVESEYLIDIVNELVHLPEPRICILISEVSPHEPHYMICSGHISLAMELQLCKGRKLQRHTLSVQVGATFFI